MPRIRTIKPEFWDSPGTARAGLRARLFFIAMWGWADDWGIGTANPKQLIGYAFPNDDDVTAADFPRLATEVADCFDVAWYTVDGRPYFAIPSWDNHQKNERRAAKRNPTPDQGIPAYAEMRGTSVQTRGETPLGTGEQGNRGTGEQTLLLNPDGPSERAATDHIASEFDEFYKAYPRHVGKDAALRKFTTIVKSGKVNPRQIIDGAKRLAADPNLPPKNFIAYPAKWLHAGGWGDEALPSRDGQPANQRAAYAGREEYTPPE